MNVAPIVERYYGHVDACAFEAIIDMFAENAVYERAGMIYEGKARIARFFAEERLIRGRHLLEDMVCWGERAIVLGRFEGVGAAGDPRSVGFVDIWEFDATGRVKRRRTLLAAGHQIVQA